MKDDWGMVMFPRGPRADTYRTFIGVDVFAVPVNYKPEEVDTILTAVQAWYAPVDDSPIAWKDTLYNVFRDPWAVDETYAMLRDPAHQEFRYYSFIPGFWTGPIIWELQGDPVRLVESVSQRWKDIIDEANENLGFFE